jgi:hypothetical protein
MVETILSSPFFSEIVLPFLLIFTVAFAVLQKSEVLGKGKKQTDALISLAIALIFVSVGKAVGIVNNLVPFLAVALVVILAFLLLFGSFFSSGDIAGSKPLKIILGIVAAVAVAIAVIYYTGVWDWVKDIFEGEGSSIATNIVFIVLIAAAIAVVVGFGGKSEK